MKQQFLNDIFFSLLIIKVNLYLLLEEEGMFKENYKYYEIIDSDFETLDLEEPFEIEFKIEFSN